MPAVIHAVIQAVIHHHDITEIQLLWRNIATNKGSHTGWQIGRHTTTRQTDIQAAMKANS